MNEQFNLSNKKKSKREIERDNNNNNEHNNEKTLIINYDGNINIDND